MSGDRRVLFKDPRLPWPGDFPYDRLAAALERSNAPSVGPQSSGREIYDAFFHLMSDGSASREERAAWDALRVHERRLVLDYFLYDVPPLPDNVFEPEHWQLPMPVELPDLLRLVAEPPDPAALDEPEKPPAVPLPEPTDEELDRYLDEDPR